MDHHQHDISDACLGLPLGQALSLCEQEGISARVMYTGERSGENDIFTPRVIAIRGDVLIAALFKDGDPRQPEE